MNRPLIKLGVRVLAIVAGVAGVVLLFPAILSMSLQYEQQKAFSAMSEQFPITVNPREKSIVESERVNIFLESSGSPLQAAVGNVENVFASVFAWMAIAVANAPWYQTIAAVAVGSDRFVAIIPGMRKEQVANAFADALSWSIKQKKEFLMTGPNKSFPLSEGSFAPGIYVLTKGTTPERAQIMVQERFYTDVVSHYGTTTASIVPLTQALTIASLIEREAGGADDMRMISGIIWNRLFINMRLQIDATLQYAKANSVVGVGWWPRPLPADRFRTSPYNTYAHGGLPPTPIANPSVAAIVAALNPRDTSCLFYFHDSAQQFHCTDTYAEHVVLLKKYYGRGK